MAHNVSAEERRMLQATVCRGLTDDEVSMFLAVAARTGLDPLTHQIYAIKRRDTVQVQVSIDGLRIIAERTGKYAGQVGPQWCGDDGVWRDVWLLSSPPSAARVGVVRRDFAEPIWGVARYGAYVQRSGSGVTPLWAKMPDLMLAKCAEALALRRAFPTDLSGVVSGDEMVGAGSDVVSLSSPLPQPQPQPQPSDSGAGEADADGARESTAEHPDDVLWLRGELTDPASDVDLAAIRALLEQTHYSQVAKEDALRRVKTLSDVLRALRFFMGELSIYQRGEALGDMYGHMQVMVVGFVDSDDVGD